MGIADFWKDRRTLVTGSTGLVGGWLVKALLEKQADIICLIRDWTPRSQLLSSSLIDRVTSVRGDVCDQFLLERAMGEYEVQTVMHLAAQTIVGIANRNPVSTFETNIRGTWSLLEACRRSPRVEQIILASSDKAYGTPDHLPYTEETPLRGNHPYDVSKACADLLAISYFKTYGLPVAITRCGNFYGGGDLNWNRIVPGTIRSVLRGVRPEIRTDGLKVRDYLYVEDGTEAYLLLAERLAEDPGIAGQAFNFSNETRTTVIELVRKILHLMDTDLEPVILGETVSEIDEQHLSAEKARAVLRWKPLFSFEEGMARTISWYEDFLGVKP